MDIGGAPTSTMSSDLVDITWSPAGGQTFLNTNPGTGMFMARVTLADGTNTEMTLLLQDANGPSGPFSIVIQDRCIPEPSSGAILLLGLWPLLRRR